MHFPYKTLLLLVCLAHGYLHVLVELEVELLSGVAVLLLRCGGGRGGRGLHLVLWQAASLLLALLPHL